MEMGRIGDPLLEAAIQFVVDGDCIWGVRLALICWHDPAADPVMHDPVADAVFLANLTHAQCSLGRSRRLNAMFVSQPRYRAARNRLSWYCALAPFTA